MITESDLDLIMNRKAKLYLDLKYLHVVSLRKQQAFVTEGVGSVPSGLLIV